MNKKEVWKIIGYVFSVGCVIDAVLSIINSQFFVCIMMLAAGVLVCPLFYKFLSNYDKKIKAIIISTVALLYLVSGFAFTSSYRNSDNKEILPIVSVPETTVTTIAETTTKATTTAETTVTTTEEETTVTTTEETTAVETTISEKETVAETTTTTYDTNAMCMTIKSILLSVFDSAEIEYNEENKMYICSVERDGLASYVSQVMLGLEDVSDWNNAINSLKELNVNLLKEVKQYDKDAHVSIILKNDKNNENYLLLMADGKIIEEVIRDNLIN